jgi:hypothetical protein
MDYQKHSQLKKQKLKPKQDVVVQEDINGKAS